MTSYLPYLYLAIAVVFEISGTTALKASDNFSQILPTILMIASYLCSFFFVSLVMRYLPVGITYALWSGLGIVLITVISSYVFKEFPDWPAIIGLAMIIGGIIVIQLFSKSSNLHG